MAAVKSTKSAHRAGAFAARSVTRLLDTVDERSRDFRADDGVEALHDLRVSVRRLRAVLSFFAPLLGTKAARARGSLREQAVLLGELRDVDVFLGHLAEGTAPVAAEDAGGLDAELTRRRAELAGRVMELLGSRSWNRDLSTLRHAARTSGGPDGGQAARRFCRDKLDRWWGDFGAASAGMASLEARPLHLVRIRAKKLRYACETTAPLFPAAREQAAATVELFKGLQDLLGGLNDIATARRLVVQAGFTVRETEPDPEVIGEAARLRDRLVAGDRFWRVPGSR